MIIGTPKEVKTKEFRVGLIPASVHELTNAGHEVWIETQAGHGIGIDDDAYIKAGAKIAQSAQEVYEKAEMIVKVKEPQPSEYPLIKEGQILFTYLHLAPDPKQTAALIESKCVAIAYETVTAPDGSLPLLKPMSEVAGRLSIQAGMRFLEKAQGGRGILLGGVPGVAPAKVVVIGGGVSGTEAIKVALGSRANVTVFDKSVDRLRQLSDLFGSSLNTRYAVQDELTESLKKADLVVGAVLVPGASAPKIIKKDDLKKMKKGSVVVDIAIDQGGCMETSKPTTHDEPTYVVDDVIHYCVANMPGAVPHTSTFALNHATLSYVMAIANKGAKQALTDDVYLREGLNVCYGKVTHKSVAGALGYNYTPALEVL